MELTIVLPVILLVVLNVIQNLESSMIQASIRMPVKAVLIYNAWIVTMIQLYVLFVRCIMCL